VGTLIFYLTDLVGISILGVCGYKIGPGFIIIDILFTSSYFIVLITSSVFFIKYLKSISKLDESSKIYFRFYFKYLMISSLVYLIGVVSLLVVTIQCMNDELGESFEVLIIVCNVSRMLSPVMVLVVLLNHPELTIAGLLKAANECLGRRDTSEQQAFRDELMESQRMSVMIELKSLNKNNLEQLDYLSNIKDKNKACLINTILGCISLE
jgi:hypothetical protein